MTLFKEIEIGKHYRFGRGESIYEKLNDSTGKQSGHQYTSHPRDKYFVSLAELLP